jgi:hypothetical protein
MANEQTCEVGSTLAPLAVGPYNDIGPMVSENIKLWKSNYLYNVK